MKMSGDGDHARRQDECLLQTGTSAPLKPAIGVQARNLELHSSLDRQPMKLSQHRSDVVAAPSVGRRAAAFCTDCTFLSRFSGTPKSSELHQSSRNAMKA